MDLSRRGVERRPCLAFWGQRIDAMSTELYQRIVDWLTENGIEFKAMSHEPTRTSEASAAARGESVKIGGKAIVMKIDKTFRLLVLSAALKVDSRKVKDHFGTRRTRFATTEELAELTGAVPGAVPPFGAPITNLEMYVDESILANEKIAFNAGALTESIIMSTKDYLDLVKPKVISFSQA